MASYTSTTGSAADCDLPLDRVRRPGDKSTVRPQDCGGVTSPVGGSGCTSFDELLVDGLTGISTIDTAQTLANLSAAGTSLSWTNDGLARTAHLS